MGNIKVVAKFNHDELTLCEIGIIEESSKTYKLYRGEIPSKE